MDSENVPAISNARCKSGGERWTKMTSMQSHRPGRDGSIQNYHLVLSYLQSPYAEFILDGKKMIETRSYPLPQALISKKIVILRSEMGIEGVSSISDSEEIIESTRKGGSGRSPPSVWDGVPLCNPFVITIRIRLRMVLAVIMWTMHQSMDGHNNNYMIDQCMVGSWGNADITVMIMKKSMSQSAAFDRFLS